jgi:ABC-type microcin C transport system duplicated ATPase subunit YejF
VTVLGFNVLGDGCAVRSVRLTEMQRIEPPCAQNLTVSAARRQSVPGHNLSSRSRRKVLGLVGESGAGKSMVGRAMAVPPGFAATGVH